MKATIFSGLVAFPLFTGIAMAHDTGPRYVRAQSVQHGVVVADLRPAYRTLSRGDVRHGETLLPHPVAGGCAIRLRTVYVNGVIERDSVPVCRFLDGSIRTAPGD